MLPSYSITMRQLDTNHDSKVVRISNNNYQKLISQGKYGDTFDSILSRILKQVDDDKKLVLLSEVKK
jgi:hypothetical protein